MKLSTAGLKILKRYEGLRLLSYLDGGGVWTIGYGHTGADVKKGLLITPQKALELLNTDVQRFEKAVNKLLKVPVNANQFDALVCFTYNLGAKALAESTLLKKLNAGDYAGAAGQFRRWNQDNGLVVAGLQNRRLEEALLFVTI